MAGAGLSAALSEQASSRSPVRIDSALVIVASLSLVRELRFVSDLLVLLGPWSHEADRIVFHVDLENPALGAHVERCVAALLEVRAECDGLSNWLFHAQAELRHVAVLERAHDAVAAVPAKARNAGQIVSDVDPHSRTVNLGSGAGLGAHITQGSASGSVPS